MYFNPNLFQTQPKMKNSLKFAAAIALIGFCFSANAQVTKPMVKTAKTETKTEEKMETKKMEMKEDKMVAKGHKTMHHGKMVHHTTKMATKTKM